MQTVADRETVRTQREVHQERRRLTFGKTTLALSLVGELKHKIGSLKRARSIASPPATERQFDVAARNGVLPRR